MFFTRSVPKRTFADYSKYRAQTRRDFRGHCAYCFRFERHAGGMRSFEQDHYWPVASKRCAPNVFLNLYWACRTCNGIKGEKCPTDAQVLKGVKFCDACEAEPCGLHYELMSDGMLRALTPQGAFTIEHLLLNGEDLVELRRTWLLAVEAERLAADIESADDIHGLSLRLRRVHAQLRQRALEIFGR